MKLSELTNHLGQLTELTFIQADGKLIPSHFHITEAGLISKTFIDCGGVIRNEKYISFQLWVAEDLEHRLKPEKFKKIIEMADSVLKGEDQEVEIEYQSDTVGKYQLELDGMSFILKPIFTACLASNKCGIPENKQKVNLSESVATKCGPGGGCC